MKKSGKFQQQQPVPYSLPKNQKSLQEQDDEQENEQNPQQMSQLIDNLNPQIPDADEQLLQKINQEINNQPQSLKLTWAAVLQIKLQQQQLNKQMDQQMLNIQEKYQKLKAPLIDKIAKIVSGNTQQKQLYTSHQQTKAININKCKPQSIPQFWRKVLQTLSLSNSQQDNQLLDHCKSLQCHMNKTAQETNIKVIFQFSDNPIIKNKSLKIQVIKKQQTIVVQQLSKIQLKSQLQENSVFIPTFQNDDPQNLFNFCQQLKRIYDNSVFYYFYEPTPYQQQGEGNEQGQEGEENQQQNENQEDDYDAIYKVKPFKKKGI